MRCLGRLVLGGNILQQNKVKYVKKNIFAGKSEMCEMVFFDGAGGTKELGRV